MFDLIKGVFMANYTAMDVIRNPSSIKWIRALQWCCLHCCIIANTLLISIVPVVMLVKQWDKPVFWIVMTSFLFYVLAIISGGISKDILKRGRQ